MKYMTATRALTAELSLSETLNPTKYAVFTGSKFGRQTVSVSGSCRRQILRISSGSEAIEN